jgi:hypothetical protein
MFDIEEQLARNVRRVRRQTLCLPHTIHQVLTDSLDTAKSTINSRMWSLPDTHFSDEVEHYHQRHEQLEIVGPRANLRQSIEKQFAIEQALKVETGLNFASMAESATALIKPILLYYASAHLCSVYTRALFKWDNDSRVHGLSCQFSPGDVGNTTVVIRNDGLFARMAACSFLLTGNPSCFSPLITYRASPVAHTEPGERLEKFGQQEVGTPIRHISVDELVNFDYHFELKNVRERHGFHAFNGLPGTAFLIDFITIFVGSSLARYDLLGWKEILDGETNPYRIHFENTFERFYGFSIDAILARIDDPFADFDLRLFPSQPSPYSPEDVFRFETDPNYD